MIELLSLNEGQSVRLFDKDSKKSKPATVVGNTLVLTKLSHIDLCTVQIEDIYATLIEKFTLSQDEMDNVYDTLNDDESPNDDTPCITTPVTVSPQQVEQRSSLPVL